MNDQPLRRPPLTLRPDRSEVMTGFGKGACREIAPGVVFHCLVGAWNSARHLTTGIVEFAADAELPYHDHPFGESITLLSGQVVVDVEGRRYTIDSLDNISLPREVPHRVKNTDRKRPAVLHVAMASGEPVRRLISDTFAVKEMPSELSGRVGSEHVVRFVQADRYSPGDGTEFVDFCNHRLLPGIEMSGGYGLFAPGGRLPAHLHDFDESICIIEGEAACIVEGRIYRLSNLATALQPRGRIHYFKNETGKPMSMIWFYAGPHPERIVVDEICATENGNPWKASVP